MLFRSPILYRYYIDSISKIVPFIVREKFNEASTTWENAGGLALSKNIASLRFFYNESLTLPSNGKDTPLHIKFLFQEAYEIKSQVEETAQEIVVVPAVP